MQEALRKVKEEEERLRQEEEARIKAAEEAERLRQEKVYIFLLILLISFFSQLYKS